MTELKTFDSPEGAWVLLTELNASSIANQITPKLNTELPFEPRPKPITALVKGEATTGLEHSSSLSPRAGSSPMSGTANSPNTSGSGQTNSTRGLAKGFRSGVFSAGGMLVYTDPTTYSSSSSRENIVNMTATGKMIDNPTHFTILGAPYKQIAGTNATKGNPILNLQDIGKKMGNISGKTGTLQSIHEFARVKAGFTDEKSKKATEKNDSSADSKAEEKSSKEKDSARGIVTRAKSSFVQRIVQASNIGNWLTAADQQTVFIFLNASRTFLWSGTRSDHEGDQQLLSRMDLSYNTPTCHDVNPLTRTTSKLELVLGFETGDLLCYDALQCKYERMNKARENDWPITKVKWIPGSETRFVAATKDGYLMTLDRAKGTWNFPKISSDPTQHGGCTSNRTPIPDFFQCLTEPNRQSNPINLFHISNEAITDVSFSPDCQHVALVGEDGYLRIFDYVQNKLRDVFQSYFGGFTCVCWSGDGRYILTGGKDDLVSVWSFHDRTLVARCQGHKSWVRGVAFDNFMYANEGEYRFGSVGEDNMLLFWDFSMRSLIRPQNLVSNTFFNNSNESTLSTKGVKLSVYSPNLTSSTNICNTTNNVGTGNESDKNNSNNNDSNTTSLETIIHPLASRDEVSTLFPVVSVAAHGAPICNIQFSKSWVATACKHGIIKIWKRP